MDFFQRFRIGAVDAVGDGTAEVVEQSVAVRFSSGRGLRCLFDDDHCVGTLRAEKANG